MTWLYWFLVRAWLRHQWRSRRLNFGQFRRGLEGAPPSIARGTETVIGEWRRRYRW